MAWFEGLNLGSNGGQKMTLSVSTQPTVCHLVPPETQVETIVLRVTQIIEQESLHISIWGSPDGKDWGQQALFWYPQKFYQGVAPAALDLRQLPGIKFLQARWEVNRWGRCDPRPLFKFGVEIQAI
jgi:hypothetical protein